MRTVLVTGAAGFIGFHVSRALLKRGHKVIGLDNFNAYYSVDLKRQRAFILKNEGIDVIEGDICDKNSFHALFQKHPFTHVLHLAAQAGVRYARAHPEAYLKSNLEGFLTLLEVLRAYPTTKLVYASSSSVYGTNEKIPFSVEDVTDHPANFYAATKKANELMAYSYHHLYGISMIGLRYFTVYGPWGRPDMAYFSFANAMMKGEPISLFNEGKMQRDFTYIDDVVAGTCAALDLESDFEVFNIGNHRPEQLLYLVELLEKYLGKRAILRLEPKSAGEVETTYADITSSQKKLGFKPTVSLDQGIEAFVTWYTEKNETRWGL